MKIITTIFVKYPKLFEGKIPVVDMDLPEGWAEILESFCDMITAACSEVQLAEFFFEKISCSQSFLDLQYSFPADFPEEKVFSIGANAFAVRNRTSVGRVRCGALITKFFEKGQSPLCSHHLAQD